MRSVSYQPGGRPARNLTLGQARLLALSDERDAWAARLLTAAQAGYDRGYAAGVEAGRRQVLAEQAAADQAVLGPLARELLAGRPFADLAWLRWGPAGRQHAADPRPGDYPGQHR